LQSELRDYELTKITFDPKSIKPKVFIELHRAWPNYRRHEITFEQYVKDTKVAVKAQGRESKLDSACLSAIEAEFENIGRFEQLTIDEANLKKKQAIESIDEEKYEVLNQRSGGVNAANLRKKIITDVSQYYQSHPNLFPLLKELSHKSFVRELAIEHILGKEVCVSQAMALAYNEFIEYFHQN